MLVVKNMYSMTEYSPKELPMNEHKISICHVPPISLGSQNQIEEDTDDTIVNLKTVLPNQI